MIRMITTIRPTMPPGIPLIAPDLEEPLEQQDGDDDQDYNHQDGHDVPRAHFCASSVYAFTILRKLPAPAVRKQYLTKRATPPGRTPPGRATRFGAAYIMPPMPPGIAGVSSSGSATTTSVVMMRPPMEAAFCRALLVTIAGSTTPAFTRSSYWLVSAL